jgi:hypothetical protein
MNKRVLFEGTDHAQMLPHFRRLITEAGIGAKEKLLFAGCEGPCYSMATFFSFAVRDLDIDIYFAAGAKMSQLYRLDYKKPLGFVAQRERKAVRARILVLMSGLVHVPFEDTLKLVRGGLEPDGIVIGETVVPGLFEEKGWNRQIPFKYLFEFSMRNPTVYEVEESA